MKRNPAAAWLLVLVLFIVLISPAGGQTVEGYLKSAYRNYIEGQYQQALDLYDQALALAPQTPAALYFKAKCYIKLRDFESATAYLKETLEIDPKHWGAKYLLTSLAQTLPEKLPPPGYVSLIFEETDVRQAIFMLAAETGLNLIPGRDLHGTITLALTNVPTSEALSAILETAQAQLIPEGSLIRVVPIAELHRTADMDNGIFARTYKIDYVDPANITATLTSLLPDAEKIEAIKDTNYLIVRGNRAVLRKADALIKTIDTTPKQVVVEAKVLEVRAKDAADAGLDVKYQSPNDTNDRAQTKGLAGKATDSGAQGFYAQVISGNVEAYFSALATKTGTNIVASPRITTLSDKPAHILIGAKYGYKTAIVTDTSTTQTVEFLEVGTSLTITPHITKDGFIKMKVEPKVSDGQVINDLPQENTTETMNEVMVRDGQTIVIGGLYKDKEIETDIGVPFLMEIPFLGAFFRKTKTETEKNELLIFVTPHILTPETLTDMAKEAADMEERSGQKSRLIH